MHWIITEGGGHYFFALFPIVLLILFVIFRGRRVRFLLPSLLITIIVVNPWFFQKWDSLGLYAYWRILWLVPVIPVMASLVPCVTERIGKKWAKIVVTVAGVALAVVGGTFLYDGWGGSFTIPSNNMAKLSDASVEISDYLLSIDDHPRVVVQRPQGVYMRQYSGNIDLLFGRDVEGYILPPGYEAKSVDSQLNETDGDMNIVAETMANNGYEYLVLEDADREQALEEAAFELVNRVDEYGIYRAHGTPSVRKEYNALGQVTSITTLDAAGQPVNGSAGYATVSYDYDDNGFVVREFMTNVEGAGVPDSSGKAGCERIYDRNAHLLMERYIGVDGEPVANAQGYAEYRREYSGGNLVREAYFDENGKSVNRADTLYASISMMYDGNHNRIEEKYYNADGEMIRSSAGYALIERAYKGNRMTKEAYFDENDNPIRSINGYASEEREYDDGGHIILQRFLDENRDMVIVPAGYAEVRRTYEDNNLIYEAYFDERDEPVSVAAGYSAFSKTYDENGREATISYFDENDNPVRCINGYASEEREYDDGGHIILQRFLDENRDMVIVPAGYAEVRRTYEDNNLVYEAYFDERDEPVSVAAGYSAFSKTYDENGREATISYFDENENPVRCINGYASEEREYDDGGHIILQRFLDENRDMVIVPAGYAEVRRTYEDNNLVYEAYFDADSKPYEQAAGYVAIEQAWKEGNLTSRTYLGTDGRPIMRTDGYAKALWTLSENGTTWNLRLEDLGGNEVPIEGKNLAKDIRIGPDGWSEWMTPVPNAVNYCFNIGYTNLGPKQDGDVYSCHVEIEFKDVSTTAGHELRFWAQGAQDGQWSIGNVWNSNVVNLAEAPENGINSYTATNIVSGDMIDISTFNIGFRCDYWASGSFRVRNVKIERGDTDTAWTPGV